MIKPITIASKYIEYPPWKLTTSLHGKNTFPYLFYHKSESFKTLLKVR